jgi:magnesium chelatase subunit D
MKAAKGAILGLLTNAYQSRDQVALVSCREDRAELLLRPTSSVLLARQRLQRLPLGGATPLTAGLRQAEQLIATERRRQPQLQPLLVLVSDGEANVPLVTGAEVIPELMAFGRQIRKEQIDSLVIDSRLGAFGSETLRKLALVMGGGYRHVRELHAGKLLAAIREVES